jgi:hypothetical protein
VYTRLIFLIKREREREKRVIVAKSKDVKTGCNLRKDMARKWNILPTASLYALGRVQVRIGFAFYQNP